MPDGTPERSEAPEPSGPARSSDAEDKRTERHMWWYLAYFLFGIHLVALVMIFAVRHAG